MCWVCFFFPAETGFPTTSAVTHRKFCGANLVNKKKIDKTYFISSLNYPKEAIIGKIILNVHSACFANQNTDRIIVVSDKQRLKKLSEISLPPFTILHSSGSLGSFETWTLTGADV